MFNIYAQQTHPLMCGNKMFTFYDVYILKQTSWCKHNTKYIINKTLYPYFLIIYPPCDILFHFIWWILALYSVWVSGYQKNLISFTHISIIHTPLHDCDILLYIFFYYGLGVSFCSYNVNFSRKYLYVHTITTTLHRMDVWMVNGCWEFTRHTFSQNQMKSGEQQGTSKDGLKPHKKSSRFC